MRHAPPGNIWYSKNDDLEGSKTVGNPNNDAAEWSKIFETEVPNFNEFLFASGDCSKWLITTKDQAIGKHYSDGK